MIKVLQILGSLDMGGAESRMMDVFRKIDKSKYEFTFLAMKEGKQYYEDEIEALGGRVIKIAPPRKSGTIKNIKQLRQIIREGHYDVVHAHTSFHCGVALYAAKKEKVPVRIAHSRTTDSKNKSLKNKVALFLGRKMISLYSTKRVAISNEAGKYLFGKKDFEVLPNAIDVEKYLNAKKENVYEIKEDSVCLGLVGRFHKMKNHSFAVDVFSKYHEKNENSYLFFVGDGPERNAIEQRVKELGLEKHIIFTGIQSNVNEWMKLFDVLLVPSIFEGLGGVILEAQAAGTPVIKANTFTDESDMGVGLVKKLPIDEGVGAWVKAIDEMRTIEIPSNETIKKAFDERGYSLSSEIEKLEKIYSK